MSLTSHLKDAESPVRQFIHESAPELALAGTRGADGKAAASRLGFDELTALETKIPIPAQVKPAERKSHAIVAGMALDYRIRMDLPGFNLEETTARKGLDRLAANPDVVHRGKHIYKLLHTAYGLTYLTVKNDPHPLSLARASVLLAWCESIYRAGPIAALTNDLGRHIKRAKDSSGLLMSIDAPLIFDIADMHKPLVPVLDEWNQAAAKGIAYVPNPTFLGSVAVGGADGDLVLNDLLVDVKTREEITNPWLRQSLFQLLGYALLDVEDSLGIRRVGILLPRQPYFSVWKLDDLLGKDAEDALPELRDRFAGLLSGMLRARPI
ncbi:hypothetical protein [Agromyces sp. Marseille-P2726]|uniref:hypothetical protein n=1 Tax=Agromyces sp. Marseille-P2726 TaxID=2709132 RepID=UPI0015714AC0|nr:hypothetical protein [Agromyces sp. Marseille-P2726]